MSILKMLAVVLPYVASAVAMVAFGEVLIYFNPPDQTIVTSVMRQWLELGYILAFGSMPIVTILVPCRS